MEAGPGGPASLPYIFTFVKMYGRERGRILVNSTLPAPYGARRFLIPRIGRLRRLEESDGPTARKFRCF